MIRLRDRLRVAACVALMLPVLGGAAVCGHILVDITQRELILEPFARAEFEVASGNVEIYALDRNGTILFYSMVGSTQVIGDVGHTVADDTLQVVSECLSDGFCNVDWSAEIMHGVAVSVDVGSGDVGLIGVDAPVAVAIADGDLDGVGLRADTVEIEIEIGNATAAFATTPSDVTIVVETGDAHLILPAGAYRCELSSPDGDIVTDGIDCDSAATARIAITTQSGDIVLSPGDSP